jgi:TRAP-type mannitol/chloroaromatic compound transport system permease small subunit
MRIPLLILGATAFLWPFSYYQLVVNFWPYLIQSMATGEESAWYNLLYPVYTYIYLLGPVVFAAVLLYVIGLFLWRRFAGVPNKT